MVGRFIRAYPAYTAEQVMYNVPIQRFWALYLAIPSLEAADDLRALMVVGHGANVGEKGKNFAGLAAKLSAVAGGKSAPGSRPKATAVLPGVTIGTMAADGGTLRSERLAKLADLAKQSPPS